MTQTGKCDTCRQRKVKCDEVKPKCGACKKKDRPCSYSYGKVSAFVVQDPNQLTKHGKSKTPPLVHQFCSSPDSLYSPSSTSSGLRVTTERQVGDGQGFFQTLTPSSIKPRQSRKKINKNQRELEEYLRKLKEESAVISYQPSSPETTLINRYIGMLGPDLYSKQPFAILGTWIETIPSRIGRSRMLDLATEFLVNSYAAYRDNMHSKRRLAKATKAKALRELQLVVLDAQTQPTYDVLLATKMHFAAEALMGIDTMYHAIHAFGLAELMKSGTVTDVDDEHYWNLIDNTYVDDVNEAMLAGRRSVYDNDFYLSATFPWPIESSPVVLSPSQRASVAIMHVFVQCPHLVCLIRHAISNPKDTRILAAAVSKMESLIQINLSQHVSELMQTAITVVQIPASPETTDIMPDTLEFDTVQNMVLCTRYWMLQNLLCGLADTLYRRFPVEAALSLLPSPERLRVIDVDSALHLAKSMRWADSIFQEVPLVTLRLHTPLQISLGSWHRTIRNLPPQRSAPPDIQPNIDFDFEISRAKRMKSWIIDRCNQIHTQWGVSIVDEKPLLEALDAMSGELIPDWLPVRVRFEAEDGEMVMKLDYENKTGSYSERYDVSEPPRPRMPHPGMQGQEWQRETLRVHELPVRNTATQDVGAEMHQAHSNDRQVENAYLKTHSRPVDFIHGTGRNLCSTSGWWPENSTTSTVLLDSTHKTSFFPSLSPRSSVETPDAYGDADSNPSLASTWLPQTPNASSISSGSSSRNFTPPPLGDTRTVTVTFDNKKKNACFSPAWTND